MDKTTTVKKRGRRPKQIVIIDDPPKEFRKNIVIYDAVIKIINDKTYYLTSFNKLYDVATHKCVGIYTSDDDIIFRDIPADIDCEVYIKLCEKSS